MCPGQWETRLEVVKGGWQLGSRCMAQRTAGSKLAVMGVALSMAGITVAGRAGELVVDMAALAMHAHMRPGLWESRFGMVECGGNPTTRGVAGSARGS